MFIDNKYKTLYFNIIHRAVTSNRIKNSNTYYERHHIIPKSLGGSNINDNLVYLTAREHYICHRLLTKFTAGAEKKKMICAVWMFNNKSSNQQRVIITSRQYEYIRKQISTTFSEDRKGKLNKGRQLTAAHKLKISQTLTGRVMSEETRQKMRKPKLKIVSIETRQKLSAINKGRQLSLITREKMSNSKKGINPVHTQVSWICKYCQTQGIGISNYNRWHDINCKEYRDV